MRTLHRSLACAGPSPGRRENVSGAACCVTRACAPWGCPLHAAAAGTGSQRRLMGNAVIHILAIVRGQTQGVVGDVRIWACSAGGAIAAGCQRITCR